MSNTKPLDWTKNQSIYEVNVRQYSEAGTFRALRDDLPRLKELGVGILWLMPIQPIGKKNRKGSLGSYYSVKDYTKVNSEFGTKRDFKSLIKAVHKHGMYIMLDWVANHTAWDHHWSKEHPEFYTKDENRNFVSPFPEWSDVIHLNYDCKELWQAMADEMKYWLKEFDIDGFRCDMAHLVRTEFWEFLRTELNKEKQVFMLAETENRDLLNSAFDMIYNWRMFHTFNRIAKQENSVWDIDNSLEYELYDFPENKYQMFFTSNHDENSWQGSAVERLSFSLEAINALVFTIDGMPLIYNGQEAGNYSRLSFFEKDPIKWKKDKMFPFYQKLIALKKRNKGLWNGAYGGRLQRVHTDNNNSIFSFIREKDNDRVFVAINLSPNSCQFKLHGNLFTGEYIDIFNNEINTLEENQDFYLHPWEYKVWEFKK